MSEYAKYHLEFDYDVFGRGKLEVFDEGRRIMSYNTRTGSIRTDGSLANPIPIGDWSIQEATVDTSEQGMYIAPGAGWKARLYTPKGKWSHFLIHPDGGRGGTMGCLGVQNTDAPELRAKIDQMVREQGVVPMVVRKGGELLRNPTVPLLLMAMVGVGVLYLIRRQR